MVQINRRHEYFSIQLLFFFYLDFGVSSLPRSLLFKYFLHGSVCCTIFVAPSLVCLIVLFSMVDVVIASDIEFKLRAEYCFLSLVTPVG